MANGYISYYRVKDCKSTVFKEFLNADREVKLIRSAGKLFHKLTTRSEKKNLHKLYIPGRGLTL